MTLEIADELRDMELISGASGRSMLIVDAAKLVRRPELAEELSGVTNEELDSIPLLCAIDGSVLDPARDEGLIELAFVLDGSSVAVNEVPEAIDTSLCMEVAGAVDAIP